jgi:hypothetical protein
MFLTHALRAIYRSAVAASDALWEYVTLLLTGSPQTSTFVTDASTNNFQVTINGDTRPNNFSPYTTGYYSNLFNGTTDYLSVPLNSAFDITGDFTVECWVYFTALPSPNQDGNRVASMAGYSNGTTANQGFELGVNFTGNEFAMASWGSGNRAMCSFTPVLNTWYHFAATKQSSTSRLFINGVSQTLTVNTLTINSAPASSVLNIGRSSSSSGGALNYFHYVPGYISNFRIVKGTAVYTASFTPPTAPLTAIANTSLLTCQANRLIDSSTNNFTITRNGSTSISPFDPFVPSNTFRTYGSTYFDGTGDYLTVPYTTALQLPGNFTIECWVNITSKVSNFPTIVNNYSTYAANGGVAIFASHNGGTSGKYNIAFNGAFPVINSTTSINYGTWQHIALVRSGSTLTLYIDGVANGTSTQSATVTGTANNWWIGTAGDDFSLGYLNGYVSNFRVVKGTAVYTANFTPPTAPLTAIANTSLLTLQTNQPVSNSAFIDNSSINNLITRNGNATQGAFSPYGGDWSNYFDGTGDYLTVPYSVNSQLGSSNFTIEFWVNFPSVAADQQIISAYTGATNFNYAIYTASSGTLNYYLSSNGTAWNIASGVSFGSISANTWIHVALVRNGSTFTPYLNGVAGTATTNASAIFTNTIPTYIGAAVNVSSSSHFTGYISNLRIVNGTAVYTANFTPPTLPLTAVANTSLLTCQSNSLIDNSLNRFAITRNGDVSVQPFSPFNPASLLPVSYGAYFDGTGDYLTVPNNAPGTGDFTLECWVYATATPSDVGIFESRTNGLGATENGFTITAFSSSVIRIFCNGILVSSTGTSYVNTWCHVAVVRSSGTWNLYINGVSQGTASASRNLTNTDAVIGAGRYNANSIPSAFFPGYISNLRIVNGTAVYTANFTPSTIPLTAVANTSLLTCQSDRFIDNSTNNFAITNNGDARPVTQNPFGFTSALTTGYDVTTVGGSGYFDGTGDYLSLPYTTAAFFLQNSYTIEAWVNPANVSTWKPIFTITAANTGGFGALALVVGNAAAYAEVRPTTGGSISSITGGTIVPNVWHHIALSVNNTSARLFLNGVQVGSTVTFPNFSFTPVGAAVGVNANLFGTSTDIFNGYISDLRVIKGTALYTGPFVPPVAPVTAITNTTFLGNFANAGVIDYSGQGNLETVGGARVSTAVSKYSGSSLYFDGTGDYAVQPTNLNFGYGTGDFTIEFWLYLNTVSADQTIVSNLSSATSVNPHIYLNGASNTIRFFTNSADRITGSSLSANTWYHIAVCRASGSTKMFINGTQTGSTYTDANNYGTTAPIGIGTYWSSGSPVTTLTLNGYIDDLRVTKAARYTANFTPPTAALPTF